MKKIVLCNLLFLLGLLAFAQPAPVKNVILLITDGTSTSLLSCARWYQTYLDSSKTTLYIDPYIKGLIRTNSSDAPIGDSAPTTSCYMTGYPSQTGFVSTYPVKTDHDLLPVDANRAYQPLTTLLEAAHWRQGKATGLVFTCEFPHATPADCAAHTYSRGKYSMIAPQMVYNNLDVVIGGGTSYLKEPEREYLKSKGYNLFLDDLNGMRNCHKGPFWALYRPSSIEYYMEADNTAVPSLAESTEKAIEILSQNPNGFFLMVEGSKVDWAAHDNDAKAAIIEFIEFDKACKAALDFAQKDGQTLVVILPDHGTGAVTIGNTKSNHGYDKLSLKQIMEPIDNYKISLWSMGEKLKAVETTEWPALFRTYFDIDLQKSEIQYLSTASDYSKSTMSKEDRKDNLSMVKMLSQVIYGRTYFGFTTFGHTMENVFYAMYQPHHDELQGYHTNVELHKYICHQMGLDGVLDEMTDNNFVDHRKVFEGYDYKIDSLDKYHYRFTAKYKRNTLTFDSYTNYVTVNKKTHDLESVLVYMPINKTFYVPKELFRYLLLK
ncbi:MAG: alkaline phosphatase [Bacteroidales bacterium]|nr:alkaline phosphatase [Bacteroidales bacterium]